MTTTEKIFDLIMKSGKSEYLVKKEIGLPNSTFSEWRAGRAKPSADALAKIADYFNVSVDYLLGRTEIPNTELKIPPELEGIPIAFYEGIKDLSSEELETVNKIIQSFANNKKKPD